MSKKIVIFLATIIGLMGIGTAVFFIFIKKDVSISRNAMVIYVGYDSDLYLKNYDGKVEWYSDNEKIATVKDGTVTAKAPGEINISCVTEAGDSFNCYVRVYDIVSDDYYEFAEKEADWLMSLQLSDGSFSCYELEENMPSRINPYFGSYAAIAILRNDHKNIRQQVAEDYIDWYFSHMNLREDVKGSLGTIYDYKVIVEDGKIVEETSMDSYDSADSYAAMFFVLLYEYYEKYGDVEIIIKEKNKIDMLSDLLISLTSGYYTESKNESGVKYLMNNMEVYEGLGAAYKIYELLWETDPYCKRLGDLVKGFEDNFNKRWVGNGYYYPVLNEDNEPFYGEQMHMDKLYEYALPQLFPVMFGITSNSDWLAIEMYQAFCDEWDWVDMNFKNQSEANSTWSLISYAAVCMRDFERFDEYLKEYDKVIEDRTYPYYSGDAAWIVLACEEAYEYYNHLEKNGIPPIGFKSNEKLVK